MNDTLKKIKELVDAYFNSEKKDFIPHQTKIPLNVPSYETEEVVEALESMLSKWVTMGKKVLAFEKDFASYLGVKYATMVNSGSSANLIALSILTNPFLSNKIKPGEEIITPATTWITTIYPIVNVNAIPVIVDVNLETLNIDVEKIERAITDKTRAIMPVHLLGNPCDIKRIMEIAEERNLFIIEDSCESPGAEINGKKVGSFGDLATFSFFFSHHISTIEGGMVVTNNEEYFELSKALRVFGWTRDLKNSDELAKKYPSIDKRFLFVNLGFNFRPTEIQGAFGIHQMKKLERFIETRRENAKYWNKRLNEYSDYFILPEERPNTRHAWFGYPLTVIENPFFTRDELTKHLEENKIETRPIMVPNVIEQPAINLIQHKIIGDLKNSKYIAKNSFWIGNHQGIGKEEREYIADVISSFVSKRIKK